MKRIITVQHTRSLQHENGMIGSLTDWTLTDEGFRQAQRIGVRLAEELKDTDAALYSSDLTRARQTAEQIALSMELKPQYTPALREFDLGEAVGKTKSWAKKNNICPLWPDTIDWAENADGIPFPGAQSRRDMWEQVSVFLEDVLTAPAPTCILVSHSGTLSILFALWLGMEVRDTDRCLLAGKAGGVSELAEDTAGHRILVRLNDMSYVQE